jgi:outer membrane protein assembly factor BamB
MLYSASAKSTSKPEAPVSFIRIINSSFLGGGPRNYYGDSLPDKLDVLFAVKLGSGETFVKKDEGPELWSGAGWTGQPLVVEENGEAFLVIGAYDHMLKKIRMRDGEIIWQYAYDDVIKGTGTLWHDPSPSCPEMEYLIMQGSRLGNQNTLSSPVIPSYRAISLQSGKAVWKYNSHHTASYSRDVDGSALVVNDTAYLGLENGLFAVFDPSPENISFSEGLVQPTISRELPLYENQDIVKHGGNLVTESSPCLLNRHIYISSGSGHIYGYNLKKKTIDWDFYTGSDIDGSPVVTSDSCILVTIEKQYIAGHGGVLKLDPSKSPEHAVVWFFPTGDAEFGDWQGGIIGSACVNHRTRPEGYPDLAAFTAIDGYLYVVLQNALVRNKTVVGIDDKTRYPVPPCIFKYRTGPSISTPIIVGNRMLVAGYGGIFLFKYNRYLQFTLMDKKPFGCESTPFAYKGRVFIASRDGNLYCLGQQ